MHTVLQRSARILLAMIALGAIAVLAAPRHPGQTPYDRLVEKVTVQVAHAQCNENLCVRNGEFKACMPDDIINCTATVVNGQPSCENDPCE
jgi:hypothetical protein